MQAEPHPGDIVGSVNLARGAAVEHLEFKKLLDSGTIEILASGRPKTSSPSRATGQFGINKSELYAGIGLCMEARLIDRTVKGRYKGGKGQPAKYALSWRTVNEFPAFNLEGTSQPSNTWKYFKPQIDSPRSLAAAERHLGLRKAKKKSFATPMGGDSIEASVASQTKSAA